MDLVAGETREILLALAVEDFGGLADGDRFDAHVALGAGLDPTWLDLFSEAVRSVTGDEDLPDFLDARLELDGPGDIGERTVERVDPVWIASVARVTDAQMDALAGQWIGLLEEELGLLPREEKPWIRDLTGRIVRFARAAQAAPDVVFAWSL